MTRMSFGKLAAIAGAALALSLSTANAENWDIATPYPEANFHTQNILQFTRDVEQATNGALTFTVHPANSLIAHPEIKNSVRAGTIPAGEFLLGQLANEHPIFELDMLPFIVGGYDDARAIWAASKARISELLARQNMRVLFSVPWPNNGVYSSRAINVPGDFAGLKMRTYNATTDRLAQLLGAVPTQVEVSDISQAFAMGRVEAVITSAATGVSISAWDFVDRYYDVNSFLGKNIVVVNERRFSALPADVQAAVLKAAELAEARGWEASVKNNNDMAAVLVEMGMKVEKVPPEVEARFKEIGQIMLGEWLSRASEEDAAVVKGFLEN